MESQGKQAGREKVGKKGVVREKSTHHEVIDEIVSYAQSIGFEVLNITYSPIKGPEGNIEYLIHLKKSAEGSVAEGIAEKARRVVDEAFGSLKGE